MKDFVRVELDPGRSARPGLVLLTLGSPKPLGCPTAGSLFLLFLKSLARLAELKEGIRLSLEKLTCEPERLVEYAGDSVTTRIPHPTNCIFRNLFLDIKHFFFYNCLFKNFIFFRAVLGD